MTKTWAETAPSGLTWSHGRGHMSTMEPPADYRWSTPTVEQVEESAKDPEWKFFRSKWLEGLNLQISPKPEKGYRYWRWLDKAGTTVWSERRPWNDPLPQRAGFWPSDK